jgi:putative flavoprotein involved in K+ transport
MPATTTVVVGAGHCGLAMSYYLAARSIDHVLLEGGQVAHSWRTQRWDSLTLLTPNWMTRLPGYAYDGDEPDGYLPASGVAGLIDDYAAMVAAPVQTDSKVTQIIPTLDGFTVTTDHETWQARSVVLAVGTSRAALPRVAEQLPATITSLPAIDYRNPSQLADGGVIVVGASASGVQIAEEVQRSGCQVTLAVGEHVRMPRRYRGRDIFHGIDAASILEERWDEVDDVVRARHLPSMQLVGADRTVDLNALQDAGIQLVGRLGAVRGTDAQFAGSLRNVCALADLKLDRLLDRIDEELGGAGERFEPTRVPAAPLSIDLGSGEIRTVIWATGIEPDLSCVAAPVFDARGRIKHDGGVTPCPGLFIIGLPMLRRRRSTFLDGARTDAADLVAELSDYLDRVAADAR